MKLVIVTCEDFLFGHCCRDCHCDEEKELHQRTFVGSRYIFEAILCCRMKNAFDERVTDETPRKLFADAVKFQRGTAREEDAFRSGKESRAG